MGSILDSSDSERKSSFDKDWGKPEDTRTNTEKRWDRERKEIHPALAAVFGVFFIVLLVFIGLTLFHDSKSLNESRNPRSGAIKYRESSVPSRSSLPATQAPQPKLELVSWNWTTKYDKYAIIEGLVKNISTENQKNVEVVITFYDKNGRFITSETALSEYNPILPGQTSPFTVYADYNPAMRREKTQIDFKRLLGGSIKWKH